jgi:hypothetical protein
LGQRNEQKRENGERKQIIYKSFAFIAKI